MLDSPLDSRLLVLVARSADRVGLAEAVGRSLCIALDVSRDEENNRDEEAENNREERRERHVQPASRVGELNLGRRRRTPSVASEYLNVNVEETERAFLDRVEQLHVQHGCTGWVNPNLPRQLSNDFSILSY